MTPPPTPQSAILVVDDDVEILRFLRETLGALTSCAVDTSPNPEYAFELSLRKQYALFLFDFSMPNINGAVLYHLIRKVYDLAFTPPRPLPPLILMSGQGEQRRARELMNQPGVRGLLSKPFSIDRLLTSVESGLPGVIKSTHRARFS
jgi:CheY-like chemotaxis protein